MTLLSHRILKELVQKLVRSVLKHLSDMKMSQPCLVIVDRTRLQKHTLSLQVNSLIQTGLVSTTLTLARLLLNTIGVEKNFSLLCLALVMGGFQRQYSAKAFGFKLGRGLGFIRS